MRVKKCFIKNLVTETLYQESMFCLEKILDLRLFEIKVYRKFVLIERKMIKFE